MESENAQVFKLSRVLWFPMSVNAVALGALCCIAFCAWTFLVTAIFGRPHFGDAMTAVSTFDDRVGAWLLTGRVAGTWEFALQALGAYLIWAIGGIAIARIMAVRIARDEYITMKDALAFAWSTRNTALLYAPAILLSMLFLWVTIFGIGLIGQIPWVGGFISAVFLPVTIFFTILVRILAFAGVVSLGMTAGAIACEKKGTWDSVAKSFNYLFARPLAVLLYVALLVVFVKVVQGVLLDGDHLREHVSELLVPLWDNPEYRAIARGAYTSVDGVAAKTAAFLHSAIFWVIDALIAGAVLSWIIGAFTAMFLIFRREVDGTDYTEIVGSTELRGARTSP